MTQRSVAHDTFVIERTYDAPVKLVFEAWADPTLKARWFVGSRGARSRLRPRLPGRRP